MTTQTITIDDFLRAREIKETESRARMVVSALFSSRLSHIDERGYLTDEDTRVYDAIGALTDAVMEQKGFSQSEVADAWNTVSQFFCKGRSYTYSLPPKPLQGGCYACSLPPEHVPQGSYR